ncbi:mitogen-activated protein kinase [Plectosphaerella plurivora]|uniref:Mitogen-activated protein kinase n=1 Tax=Plectosphaerella plurivora TaxID=936078 RepID=A0A9P8VB56_9PEZI|nr:mitogen-activated protein kinase [Plectosphaerella plurivora]
MADVHGPSEEPSEERTEPFSQSELECRLSRIRGHEPDDDDDLNHAALVPLGLLRVEDHHHEQGIRLLVRPLIRSRSVSPGDGSCQWVALRAEVAACDGTPPHHKVLAVTQTSRDIKFSVRIPSESLGGTPRPPLWCELYYDPASDNQILLNRSEVPIILESLPDGLTPSSPDEDDNRPAPCEIKPIMTMALTPGSWRISVGNLGVLDFRVLQKAPISLVRAHMAALEPSSSSLSAASADDYPSTVTITPTSSAKRALTPDDDGDDDNGHRRGSDKRARTSQDARGEDNVIMFLRPAAGPLVFPMPRAQPQPTTITRELVPSNTTALLDVQKDETISVPAASTGDHTTTPYTITKRDQIAATALSSVYTAHHSDVPGGVVTVKVLKTRPANAAALANQRPQDAERNVIRQADMWLREYQSQGDLNHNSIVRLYGGDARFLSLYMEHVDARDLAARNVWRSPRDDHFQGSRLDAARILRDIASALHYLHARRRVHNDIKPANVLYSPDRGAVLCDFGLSTPASGPATSGGTPYYVPPEFIGARQRGAPSDVWALGVTMLYVLGRIPFPDARTRQAHPKPLYWMIADVNRPGAAARAGGQGLQQSRPGQRSGMSAADQMMIWLGEVREAANRLDPRQPLERLVREMLVPNPNQRITTARVAREMRDLFDERGRPIAVR